MNALPPHSRQPAAPSKGRTSKKSEFGQQLREKQRARLTYGLPEYQFARTVRAAMAERKREFPDALIERLERRLDNIVFRLGLAASRRHARQLVVHGAIEVSGKKVTIPSYLVPVGVEVRLARRYLHKRNPPVSPEELAKKKLLPFLHLEAKVFQGKLARLPSVEDVAPDFDIQKIAEFYRR